MKPDIESIERHNRTIEKANKEIESLGSACVSAREMVQGVELTIERSSFRGRNYVSRSYRIIPWE